VASAPIVNGVASAMAALLASLDFSVNLASHGASNCRAAKSTRKTWGPRELTSPRRPHPQAGISRPGSEAD
jgi:hypothetical protein